MRLTDNMYYERLNFDINMPDGSKNSRMTYVVLLKYNKNVLIDSGVLETLPEIYSMLEEARIEVKDLDILINTHCHFDHTGGNYDLKKHNPKMKILAHAEAKEFIEFPDKQNEARPVPSYKDLIKKGVEVEVTLKDGDVIDIGTPLEIIHTPGHSIDSISVYLPEEKVVIVGDAVPRHGDLPIYEDLTSLRQTLEKISNLDYNYLISAFTGLYDKSKDPGSKNNLIDEAISYLGLIDKLVEETLEEEPQLSVEGITKKLVAKMDLPEKFPPFVYKSISEHVKNK